MALTANNPVTKTDMDSLKSKIKAEMKRRKYNKNLNVAANTGNFSTAITAGTTKTNIVYFNETVKLLSDKIKSQGITASQYSVMNSINVALTNVNKYAGRAVDSSTNDCSSNCNGLCVSCNNTCKGSCSGRCTGNCGQSCNWNCNATCAGVHSMCDGCANGCIQGCVSYCYTSSYSDP